MSSPAKPLTYLAFALMVLAGLLGGIFAAGYAFADLDTPQAIGSTAPWLVLAILLSVFAYVSRTIAPWALAALTAFTVVRTPIESALARLVDEPLTERPSRLYGEGGSHYQSQGLKLSKHFRAWV